MKKRLLFGTLTLVGAAGAALPPQHQNSLDLDVMVEFVKAHPRVAATLRGIDLRDYTVSYGLGEELCQATFERRRKIRWPAMVGPQAPLKFKRANCPLD